MDENVTGRRAGRQLGAFEFMDGKPHDVLVVVRFKSGEAKAIRQIQVYYSEFNRISTFVFDEKDPAFFTSPTAFQDEAAKVILGEVKSRVRGKGEFSVWYYSSEERDTIDQVVGTYLKSKPQLLRYGDDLIRRSRIIELS